MDIIQNKWLNPNKVIDTSFLSFKREGANDIVINYLIINKKLKND